MARLLTICIASYNNGDHLCQLIRKILSFKSDEIEVVVSDNASDVNTVQSLKEIEDDRFFCNFNENNLGAVKNYMKALSMGSGEYKLFMIDKDNLLVSELGKVLNLFRKNKDCVCGYISLDSKIESVKYFMSGLEGLKNIAYLSKHPTGYFFKRKLLPDLIAVSNYSDYKIVNSFPFEFILAEYVIHGKSAIISMPILEIAKPKKGFQSISSSYSAEKKNLFFHWEQRLKLMVLYSKHLKSLEISLFEKKLMLRTIFQRQTIAGTIGFKVLIANEYVCKHYQTETKKISFNELLKIYLFFIKCYWSTDDLNMKITKSILILKTLLTISLSYLKKLVIK